MRHRPIRRLATEWQFPQARGRRPPLALGMEETAGLVLEGWVTGAPDSGPGGDWERERITMKGKRRGS